VARYAELTDAEMRAVRRDEQRRAATLGRYACLIQLAHPSADAKTPGHAGVRADLAAIFSACAPAVVYLHNPADKHDTHVAVLLRCLEALRAMPHDQRPRRVLGCEVWRGLDWLVEADKVALDAGQRIDLARQLLETFDSQIGGGKRYDLATLGRRAANATFHAAHAADETRRHHVGDGPHAAGAECRARRGRLHARVHRPPAGRRGRAAGETRRIGASWGMISADDELSRILREARTIAVVGLSADPEKPSHEVAAYLQAQGYRIIPVNPRGGVILGETVYADLRAVPEPIDLVDVFRPAAACLEVARGAVAVRAKAYSGCSLGSSTTRRRRSPAPRAWRS
jgi:predicted CoA-binding protein/LmbE family N-acetylglucosaminyl deacetylase